MRLAPLVAGLWLLGGTQAQASLPWSDDTAAVSISLAAAGRPNSHEYSVSSVETRCEFVLDGWAFDLCPMLAPGPSSVASPIHFRYSEDTPPTATIYFFRISIWGPLPFTQLEERNEDHCPPGTWVCLKGEGRPVTAPISCSPDGSFICAKRLYPESYSHRWWPRSRGGPRSERYSAACSRPRIYESRTR